MTAVEEMQRDAKGDPKSIAQFCLDTWEPLYRFLYFKVQNREEAEDINNGVEAVVVAGGQIRQVYLRRLVRQDETGVWSVVGYDPR